MDCEECQGHGSLPNDLFVAIRALSLELQHSSEDAISRSHTGVSLSTVVKNYPTSNLALQFFFNFWVVVHVRNQTNFCVAQAYCLIKIYNFH